MCDPIKLTAHTTQYHTFDNVEPHTILNTFIIIMLTFDDTEHLLAISGRFLRLLSCDMMIARILSASLSL